MAKKETDYRLMLLSAYKADADYLRGHARYRAPDPKARAADRRLADEARRTYLRYRRELKRKGVI